MFRTLIFAGFGAALTLTPLPALAAMKPSPAAPIVMAQATQSSSRLTTGSHKKEMRARRNQSRERARNGAEHARKARQHPN